MTYTLTLNVMLSKKQFFTSHNHFKKALSSENMIDQHI